MPEKRMRFDRYHATMGNFANTDHSIINGKKLADRNTIFYVTQRKLAFAPCVGHRKLTENDNLRIPALNTPLLRFLRQDKAGLHKIADKLNSPRSPFIVRTVEPGRIVFANEPIADIEGPFDLTQLMEVAFEHAFDGPMYYAGKALAMRLAAGTRHLSEFALRRAGGIDRALEISEYSYIGGFEDTSNMDSGYTLDTNTTGTTAHYYYQAFSPSMYVLHTETDELGRKKHFEQIAIEKWLDGNPNGTTILLDTIRLKYGLIHTIRAAKSSAKRKSALKYVRIDSGDLPLNTRWIRDTLDANGLNHVGIIATGDIDEKEIENIVAKTPEVNGFGVGTSLVTGVSGVIFKLCAIDNYPTMKLSETPGKETIAGQVQVWRCLDSDGFYFKDVITTTNELPQWDSKRTIPLLKHFHSSDRPTALIPSIYDQKKFVEEQISKFKDIKNYPVEMSQPLEESKKRVMERMLTDEMEEEGVVMVDYPK